MKWTPEILESIESIKSKLIHLANLRKITDQSFKIIPLDDHFDVSLCITANVFRNRTFTSKGKSINNQVNFSIIFSNRWTTAILSHKTSDNNFKILIPSNKMMSSVYNDNLNCYTNKVRFVIWRENSFYTTFNLIYHFPDNIFQVNYNVDQFQIPMSNLNFFMIQPSSEELINEEEISEEVLMNYWLYILKILAPNVEDRLSNFVFNLI